MIPSVFSYSSTPENFERSHLPAVSDTYAWGMLRASASSSASRVLGGGDDVGLRRVGDHDPAFGGGVHVDVVHPHARAPDRAHVGRLVDQLGGELRRGADQDAVVLADPLRQLLVAPVEAEVDVEVLAQQLHAGVADLLLDQHLQALATGLRCSPRALMTRSSPLPTRYSDVSACTSAGSTAGNIPIRSWLRPSLR